MTQAAPTHGVRDPNHHVWVEQSPKWVRVFAGGELIADSKRAMLLRETRHTPVYYFPVDDVRMELLERTDHGSHCPYKGDAIYWTLNVGEKVEENAVWSYPEPLDDEVPDLNGYVAFYWNKFDAWFEEDEQIFVHPKDPYKRVDVIPSSRHVEVLVDGEIVADTRNPVLLFETGLPVRYYVPVLDVRQQMLGDSERVTRCPYKGEAHYYSVTTGTRVHTDLVWYYRYPLPESTGIAGHLAFFNERAEIRVDGEVLEQPQTRWSKEP